MQNFNNKVAVITGAGSGVGRSLAFNLGKRGAKIVLADVDKEALETTAAALHSEGISTLSKFCDVTSRESCEQLAVDAFEYFGEVHLVFANAGVGAGESGPLWDYSRKDWNWGFNVNVWGVLNTIEAFIPKLLEQNTEAHFIVTGSGNGAFIMLPDQPIYTATKATVQAITENLFFQVSNIDTPVKINALFPGPNVVDTGIFNSDRVRPTEFEREVDKPDSGISSVDDMKKLLEQFDIDLATTTPDEVAETAVQGLIAEKFWILPLTESTEEKIRARTDAILARENPTAPSMI